MRKKLATKICAVALSTAMVASLAGCGGGDEGGQSDDRPVVRVNGNIWDNLKEPVPNDKGEVDTTQYDKYWGFAHQLEDKYNVKIEWVELTGDDGYSAGEKIIQTCLDGKCFADIMAVSDDVFITLMTGDYLADITDTYNELEQGSLWTEAATWKGHVYGQTFDGIGNCYVMVYSRDYLQSLGMTEMPTDKFLQGKWSYDDCIEYLTEMKSKLPDGTYPLSVHYYHWASMAPAANGGVVSVDSYGNLGFTDPAYTEALEFYVTLQNLGLAQMMVPTDNGDGTYSSSFSYGHDNMSTATEGTAFVMTMAEGWQYQYLLDRCGQWGIVPWPWGSQVTCTGDYTTISDNYRTVQSIWTDIVVPKKDYRQCSELDDITLFKIARDMYDLNSPDSAAVRRAAWEAEQKGEKYEYLGDSPGSMGSFCTLEDVEVFDWLHSRIQYDWGHAFDNNDITNVWELAKRTVAVKLDARTVAETYLQEAEANMKDKGLK